MLRIAICDDEINICNLIEETIRSCCIENGLAAETEVFYSGESLYCYLQQGNRLDLIFLDIEMERMNGIEVSERIRTDFDDIDTEIVYVTCTTQYDRRLFDYHPLAFIAKPPSKEQVQRALILTRRKRNLRNPYFSFTSNRQIQAVPYSEILYFESADRKVEIITDSSIYSYYGNLSDINHGLPPFFCQVHRSYIINLRQIAQYGGREVTMKNGQKISIGKNYREGFSNCQLAEFKGL